MGRAMIETDVAIVGAGGGGAVLALMLAQQGVRSLVLERAAGPPQGLRGEILQPNGQRVLDRLGLLDKLPPPMQCGRSGDSIFAVRAVNGSVRWIMVSCRLLTIAPW
ncbi:MAG TPA: FAD-dependent monooxygenase [Nitrospira sp.]|nr:FAD-dependent monooxygenase [Nitrospira sp.]